MKTLKKVYTDYKDWFESCITISASAFLLTPWILEWGIVSTLCTVNSNQICVPSLGSWGYHHGLYIVQDLLCDGLHLRPATDPCEKVEIKKEQKKFCIAIDYCGEKRRKPPVKFTCYMLCWSKRGGGGGRDETPRPSSLPPGCVVRRSKEAINKIFLEILSMRKAYSKVGQNDKN